MRPIIVAGPTASGKTTLGIQLAKRFGGAVISADSRMVYRRLDIGTGKPTWEHQTLDHSPWIPLQPSKFGPVYAVEGIKHYGLDLVDPETPFSLTDWLQFARPLIAELQETNIRPIVVGGTGLYLRALLYGYQPGPTDHKLRQALTAMASEELFELLKPVDPVTAERERDNPRRLARAIEVFRLTGQPFSQVENTRPLPAVVVASTTERSVLYQRIDERLHERLNAGLIDEVLALLADSVSPEWLKQLGLEYRYVADWIEAASNDRATLETKLAFAIHRYARRQLTYLRHQLPVRWVKDLAEAAVLV